MSTYCLDFKIGIASFRNPTDLRNISLLKSTYDGANKDTPCLL